MTEAVTLTNPDRVLWPGMGLTLLEAVLVQDRCHGVDVAAVDVHFPRRAGCGVELRHGDPQRNSSAVVRVDVQRHHDFVALDAE